MGGIISGIEGSKEYLLSECDFVVEPDYIYISLPAYEVSLCYLAGYEKDITDQLIRLIEYLMNKVDYNDEQGVLLIYGLYKISREESLTLDKFKTFLNKRHHKEPDPGKNHKNIHKESNDRKDASDNVKIGTADILNNENLPENKKKGVAVKKKKDKKITDTKSGDKDQKGKRGRDKRNEKEKAGGRSDQDKTAKRKQSKEIPGKLTIPVMEERIDSEEEILVYSGRTISFLVLSVIVYIIIIYAGYKLNFYQDSYSGEVDMVKMSGYILVLSTAEIYTLNKFLQKKNKVPKIKEKTEYVNSILEYEDAAAIDKNEDLIFNKDIYEEDSPPELNDYDSEKTTFLRKEEEPVYILESIDPLEYKNIKIIEFPFFIGKLNKQVELPANSNVISRFHAKIEEKEGKFYITDLNSTNGTFLNSTQLEANETKELCVNDEVSFANIRYWFKNLF